MIGELTPIMGEEQRREARALSMQGLQPPSRLPRYEQEKFLGKGAFGEVWSAVDRNNGRLVAIKFFNRRGGLDWSLLAREVEKLRYLATDRYVVQMYDVGWDADPPYYVMEFMENGSLEERLRSGPLPVPEAVSLFQEIVVGLIHAHNKGILHCDLKPGNVLLDQDGKPRLADFGQSRLSHEQAPSLGTLFYMAPEQADLKAIPDARWDVYALGALLYCMLTGNPPHRGDQSASEIFEPRHLEERLVRYRQLLKEAPAAAGHRQVPGVDPALASLIDHCLAVNPKKRFASVQSVLSALEERRLRRARRPLLVLGTVGPVLVMLVMALIGIGLFRDMAGTAEREIIDRAMESNHFAAHSVAERFALEVDKRWRILEQEAEDARLREFLETEPEAAATAVDRLHAWMQERHVWWNRQFAPGTQAALWWVDDRSGRQRVCSPRDDRFLNKYFGFRDYFHGLGKNFSMDHPVPAPIDRPNRSMVYKRLGKNAWAVAFSVPVRSLRPEVKDPIGVLGMTNDLGKFTRFQGTRNQFAVLIDVRPDETGKRGMIVEHPYFEHLQQQPGVALSPIYSQEVADRAMISLSSSTRDAADGSSEGNADFRGDYVDPVQGEFAGKWLATMEPVVVPGRNRAARTGWVVLVQERYAESVQPVQSFTRKLAFSAVIALALVALVMGALWGIVYLLIKGQGARRILAGWRRKLGLPSGVSSSSGSSHGSGSASSHHLSG